MLVSIDPLRQLERLSQQFFGPQGTWTRPTAMPMDAYQTGQELVVHFDLPGVDAESIDLNVQRNVLTVRAERTKELTEGADVQVAERLRGVFSRQLFLSDTLDTDHISAHYDAGVLTLRIPVVEAAKPRKIEITGETQAKQLAN
jgi:HSP20 family protein